MRSDIRTNQVENSSYPMYITSVEVDKVIDALLEKANGEDYVELGYNDVPNLSISRHQFDIVIKDLNKKELIKTNGYSDMHELLYGIHRIKELGGFHKEMEILQMKLERLYEQASQEEKTVIEEFISKCNQIFSGVSNIGGAISAIEGISTLLTQ